MKKIIIYGFILLHISSSSVLNLQSNSILNIVREPNSTCTKVIMRDGTEYCVDESLDDIITLLAMEKKTDAQRNSQ